MSNSNNHCYKIQVPIYLVSVDGTGKHISNVNCVVREAQLRTHPISSDFQRQSTLPACDVAEHDLLVWLHFRRFKYYGDVSGRARPNISFLQKQTNFEPAKVIRTFLKIASC